MSETTYAEQPNSIAAFEELIRSGLPELIRRGTGGAVEQLEDEGLFCYEGVETSFRIRLANGASFDFTITQRDEADEDDV